jgi:hypothetical protein
MHKDDPTERLQEFICERWRAVRQHNTRFQDCAELHVRLADVTQREAEWFMAAVTSTIGAPLFRIQDDNKHVSDRYPPNASGAPRGNVFFEKSGDKCSLRLETIVHQAATWRLHGEFDWPLSRLIVESPDVVKDGRVVLRREALDILALEAPSPKLPPIMSLAAARPHVGVEAKATTNDLKKLLDNMHACQQGRISPDDPRHRHDHKKCVALDLLRPKLFLGVAAAETWRLFPVVPHEDRAVFGEELPTLDALHFQSRRPRNPPAVDTMG